MRAVTRSKPRVDVRGSSTALTQSLSGLAALRDKLPPAPEQASHHTPDSKQDDKPNVYTRAKKLVVRRERKGHGGKTVTRVEGLNGSALELDGVAKDFKRALGCGATVDERDVLVQGDQSERIVAFLQTHGARQVIVGN